MPLIDKEGSTPQSPIQSLLSGVDRQIERIGDHVAALETKLAGVMSDNSAERPLTKPENTQGDSGIAILLRKQAAALESLNIRLVTILDRLEL